MLSRRDEHPNNLAENMSIDNTPLQDIKAEDLPLSEYG
jgi:hypothetical protein